MDKNEKMRAFVKEHAQKSPFWCKIAKYMGWSIEKTIDETSLLYPVRFLFYQ